MIITCFDDDTEDMKSATGVKSSLANEEAVDTAEDGTTGELYNIS